MFTKDQETVLPAAEYCFVKGDLDTAMTLAQMVGCLQYYLAYLMHKAVSKGQNYYRILKLSDVFVNQETIKREYKKLAILLHPDKNKSLAASDAFKIVTKAWDVLSDPVKRLKYNHELFKRGMESPETHQKVNGTGIDAVIDDQCLKEITMNVLNFLRQNRYLDGDDQSVRDIEGKLMSFLREKRRTDGKVTGNTTLSKRCRDEVNGNQIPAVKKAVPATRTSNGNCNC